MDAIEDLTRLTQEDLFEEAKAAMRKGKGRASCGGSTVQDLAVVVTNAFDQADEFMQTYHPTKGDQRDSLREAFGPRELAPRLAEIRGALLAPATLLAACGVEVPGFRFTPSPFLAPRPGEEDVFRNSLLADPSASKEQRAAWAALLERLKYGRREIRSRKRTREALDTSSILDPQYVLARALRTATDASANAMPRALEKLAERRVRQPERSHGDIATAASAFAQLHDQACLQSAYLAALQQVQRGHQEKKPRTEPKAGWQESEDGRARRKRRKDTDRHRRRRHKAEL